MDEDFDGEMDVNATQARKHFRESMQQWEESDYSMGIDFMQERMDEHEDTMNQEHSFDDINLEAYPLSTDLSTSPKVNPNSEA